MAKSDKKRQRESDEAAAGAAVADQSRSQSPKPWTKKARLESKTSLFVRSLPHSATSESLTEYFSQHYPVKHATVVLDPSNKVSRGYGFVSFADADDAIEAKEKLNNQLFGGRRLRLDIAQPRHRDGSRPMSAGTSKIAEEKRMREEALVEARKAPKLILRNLPWSIKTSDQLAALFKPYGKVKFSDLPNDRGKLSGFGFVTLRGRKNAEKALEKLNGTVVDGRTIAVDYAVDKETWDKQNDGEESDEAPSAAKKKSKSKKSQEPADDKSDKDDEEEDENMTQEDRDLANFFKTHGDDLEDEEETDDEDNADKDSNEDQDEENDDDFEDIGSDMEDDGGASITEKDEKPARPMTADNSTTLFIRNLPYSATDETLKAHFMQFGPVRYGRVVKDRTTDRPAGTGFVCFFNAEDSQACMKGAPRHQPTPITGKHSLLQDETIDPEGKYTLEGRILQISQAVAKEEATRLAESGPGARNRQEKDKRRLFLLAEGTISSGSPLYSKLSAAEIKMRGSSAAQRKKMIQTNPALHLSLTRLALRNIPNNITSKDLKALAREAVVSFAKDVKEGRREPISKEENSRGGLPDKEAERRRKAKGKGVVTQAKIVFETAQGSKVDEGAGAGKSRGYGFIEYSSHRWALMGLRYLNGHAVRNEAGKTQRLVVEFAIENANVVQRRRQLEEKFKAGPGPSAAGAGAGRPGATPAASSAGNKAKPWKKTKGDKPDNSAAVESKAGNKAETKLALRTKIIARKRSLRKKKAVSRGGK
ncbi:hypothetical protein B0T26DRAFT_705474 [Lasiosphaeria miniovina]|uniref:RRM domain-containing protein n=1 Tax=Lasiosphaeria miniovina TaxID=1954250 RepID=A0AA40AW51_9PEZI|nr:uncharacterized protein B0T26DRAFT_705474 [Lasiosphaeria miniovina]KAK0723120.1 hypothetical protein B0T26DRAFT_705474 [Lasiosphaeria miniovina]